MSNCVAFAKMNGLGNEIIVADMRERTDIIAPKAARLLAQLPETRFDQIMAIYCAKDYQADYRLDIINADGSQANACGNGTRCVVNWLYQKTKNSAFSFITKSGIVSAQRFADGIVQVNMAQPRFAWQDIPLKEAVVDTNHLELTWGPLTDAALVSMGNPHAIFFVNDDVYSYPLDMAGPQLENASIFPERCNITIAQIKNPRHLVIRTWERGAGLTKACGTAACAAVVAAVRRNLSERKVSVDVPGGRLAIEWCMSGDVLMSGPTEYEFSGVFDPQTGEYRKV